MVTARPIPSLRAAKIWSYSLTVGKQAITAILSFALAAMLGPEAFGVIAMALVFINFIQMLQQQGLMPAIITRSELTALHKDTAFWMVCGASAILTIAGVVIAPFWAGVNQLPDLTPVIQVLALTIPLSSSVVVHEAILRRNLEFKRLAFRSWASVLAGGVAGIAGALLGWGLWALVAQQLVMTVVDVIVLWGVSQWRPRLRWNQDAARELWSYSARSASSSLALFLGGRMDIVLGGAFFGPVVIGVYRMGQRVTELALDITARGMQSVSLPALSEVQHDHAAFADRFRGMLRQSTSLSLPLLGTVAGVAPCIERFLGSEWRGMATAIVLLAIVQAIRSISFLLGPALQAAGRPGTLSLLMWAFMGLNILGLVIASHGLDTDGALVQLCVAMIIATILGAALMVLVSARCLHIGPKSLLSPCMPGLIAGLMAAGVSTLAYQLVETMPWMIAGGIAGSLGLVTATMVVLGLNEPRRNRLRRRLASSHRSRISICSPTRDASSEDLD